MSAIPEVLPVLLGVKRQGGDLEVMIDLDPESAVPDNPSRLTLAFSGCDRTEQARTELEKTEMVLAEGVGSVIEWSLAPWEEAHDTVAFYVNYGADWLELNFVTLSERREHPDIALVHQRVARMAEAASSLEQRYERLRRRHEEIVAALEREAQREAERGARKLPFLLERGSALAEAVIARTDVFERVLQIVHETTPLSD